MGDRSAVLARVRQSAVQGERYAAALEALEEKTREAAYPIVLAYILDRFMLAGEQCASDNILDLADASLRHILALKKKGLYRGDTSRACSGASSVIAKKVLLMKAVQEDFQVDMTPEQSAALATVTQLTDYLLEWKAGERT